MRTRRMLYIFFLIFAIIPSIIFGVNLSDDLENKNIAKYGVECEAEVYNGYSNLTVNGVDYYYLVFKFFDENGEERHGRTTTKYTESEARRIYQNKKLEIKYDPVTFKSVEADFVTSNVNIVMFGVFSGIAGLMFVLILVTIVKGAKLNKIKKSGTPAIGQFIEAKTNVSVNGVPRYKIIYSYTNDKGEVKQAKTDSIYYFYQTEYFRELKNFNIRYSGNKSVIVDKPSRRSTVIKPNRYSENKTFSEFNKPTSANLDHNDLPSNKNVEGHISIDTESDYKSELDYKQVGHVNVYEKEVICEHCGNYVPENKRKCPNCGAKISKNS